MIHTVEDLKNILEEAQEQEFVCPDCHKPIKIVGVSRHGKLIGKCGRTRTIVSDTVHREKVNLFKYNQPWVREYCKLFYRQCSTYYLRPKAHFTRIEYNKAKQLLEGTNDFVVWAHNTQELLA